MDATLDTELEVRSLDAPFGAEVRGLTWGDLSPTTVLEITRLLRSHLVLVFRGQRTPTREELDQFFGRFGRLVLDTYDGAFHYGTFSDDETEVVRRVGGTNYVTNVEAGADELPWHNDQSHRPQLKVMSALEAIECQPGSTPTQFRDMYVAHEMLPRDLRAELSLRQGVYFDPRLPPPETKPRLCDAMHPVLTVHPHSGRAALYVGTFTHRIVGMDVDESAALLDRLRDHAEQHAPRYVHHWEQGDLVAWDNVGVQHRRDDVPPGERRQLRVHEGVAE